MRKPITRTPAGSVVSVSAIFVLLLFSQWLYAAPPAESPRVIPSSYIVVFHDDVDTDVAANELKGRFNLSVGFRYRHALRGMAVVIPDAVYNKVAADPRVDYIEQDMVVSVAAQLLPTGIDRIDAELNPAAHIDEVDVLADRIDVDIAILDTGIDLQHGDLNIYSYTYCKTQGPNASCIDDDPDANDVNGHGTHIAGTAAAIDNGKTVVGVAPGARLWAVKVLEDDGNGTGSQVIAGVDYVIQHAAEIEVANISLNGDGPFQALDDAISTAVAAGVLFALAAGNDSVDVSTVSPAGHPGAITVSAFEDYDGIPGGISGNAQDDTFAGFSNHGAGVDIMAPGRAIISTKTGGGYTGMNGTSMASPHVAGAAGLYLSQNPGTSPAAVKTALLATADYTPCANSADGTCADDTDGIQEPLLMYKNPAMRDLLLGQSGDLLNWKPLLKDSVPGNPGLESITPLINETDKDSDGVPDKVALAFNVWTVGTNTWLFKTEKRVVVLPQPCIDPVSSETDVDVKFLDETGSRSHMIFTIRMFCTESGTLVEKAAYKTIVYSADVSKSPSDGGDSWIKFWDKEAESFDLLDWDNDSQKEIVLTLAIDSETSSDARVMIFDQSDGTKEADNRYRTENEF